MTTAMPSSLNGTFARSWVSTRMPSPVRTASSEYTQTWTSAGVGPQSAPLRSSAPAIASGGSTESISAGEVPSGSVSRPAPSPMPAASA